MRNNIDNLASQYAKSVGWNENIMSEKRIAKVITNAVKYGYLEAQKQLFTFEDIKKAFIEGSHWKEKWNKEIQTEFNEFFNFPDVDKYVESLQK